MGALNRYTMFKDEIVNQIVQEIDRLKEEISLGLLETHTEYKQIAGKIAGLRASLDLMDEAESIVNKKIGA